MAVQMWQADRVFDGRDFLPEGTIVVTNASGIITDLLPQEAVGTELPQFRGILAPGLINAHCHLELSHFREQIPEGGGLVKFLLSVVNKRKEPWNQALVQEKIRDAAAEMSANGIVGVGDICNTTDAVAAKQESGILWYNLVEVLNFDDAALEQRWAHNRDVLEIHLREGLVSSVLTPHAPYSVSPATFAAINDATEAKAISVHNQETSAENELFEQGTGAFLQLYNLTKTAPLGSSGKSSLQTWLPYFTKGQTILLVHNTFTRPDDIVFAREHAARFGLQLVWCLCPGANKYIEGALPPLSLLLAEGQTVVLGTDSYSSNWQLSVAAEIKLLADANPQVPLEVLLRAATSHGAAALGWTGLGVLEKGKQPGLTLIHTDEAGKLAGTSERLVGGEGKG